MGTLSITWFTTLLLVALGAGADEIHPPPGKYHTSWVGNSFGGGGDSDGEWVQNGADEIEVTPDGTVIAGVAWDEAGRCVGLYKDGRCNHALLKHETEKEVAWGWNTGNQAVAVSGDRIYVGNSGKRLLRFRWTPGEIDSAKFLDEIELSALPVGLNARGGLLAVVYADSIELRDTATLKKTGSFKLPAARDAAIAKDGTLWVLSASGIDHFSTDGKSLGQTIRGVEKPSALSFDNKERLVVCDDGRDQQVKFFDVSAEPKQVAVFGDWGGLFSGTPGVAAPKKLFALRGAGTDAKGNLYVAMSFGNGPVGNLVLRSFTPAGDLRWELISTAFVDTFGFDPDSDGARVYSRTAAFDLDLSQTTPGREWKLRAITLDANNPGDPRLASGQTTCLRRLQGRRLLYTIGQYGGGYGLYTFDEPGGFLAHEADHISADDTWAWFVCENGDIWQGDAPDRTVRRYRFRGWKPDGKPDYDWQHPESWPQPDDFDVVRRITYQSATDALYLFGYLKGQNIESWGVVGSTARRYDGWVNGKKKVAWTNPDLPATPHGTDEDKPLTASGVDIAGDYLFLGMVKPENGKVLTHILGVADGKYVGSFAPGPEVGGNAGWQDMPFSVQATERKNGEYLVLVEEDWRGKNLLYRWTPR